MHNNLYQQNNNTQHLNTAASNNNTLCFSPTNNQDKPQSNVPNDPKSVALDSTHSSTSGSKSKFNRPSTTSSFNLKNNNLLNPTSPAAYAFFPSRSYQEPQSPSTRTPQYLSNNYEFETNFQNTKVYGDQDTTENYYLNTTPVSAYNETTLKAIDHTYNGLQSAGYLHKSFDQYYHDPPHSAPLYKDDQSVPYLQQNAEKIEPSYFNSSNSDRLNNAHKFKSNGYSSSYFNNISQKSINFSPQVYRNSDLGNNGRDFGQTINTSILFQERNSIPTPIKGSNNITKFQDVARTENTINSDYFSTPNTKNEFDMLINESYRNRSANSDIGAMMDLEDGRGRAENWQHEETKQFIYILLKHKEAFKSIRRNQSLWNIISKEMLQFGYNRSIEKCKNRWKVLVAKFKRFEAKLNHNHENNLVDNSIVNYGNSNNTLEYYDELRTLLEGIYTISSNGVVRKVRKYNNSQSLPKYNNNSSTEKSPTNTAFYHNNEYNSNGVIDGSYNRLF